MPCDLCSVLPLFTKDNPCMVFRQNKMNIRKPQHLAARHCGKSHTKTVKFTSLSYVLALIILFTEKPVR